MMLIAYSQLIEEREDMGQYTIYVFKNLNDNSFIMCTRLPNWQTPMLKKGDIGYLQYQEVIAYETKYFDVLTNKEKYYNYNGVYFLNFVKEKQQPSELLI